LQRSVSPTVPTVAVHCPLLQLPCACSHHAQLNTRNISCAQQWRCLSPPSRRRSIRNNELDAPCMPRRREPLCSDSIHRRRYLLRRLRLETTRLEIAAASPCPRQRRERTGRNVYKPSTGVYYAGSHPVHPACATQCRGLANSQLDPARAFTKTIAISRRWNDDSDRPVEAGPCGSTAIR
jgi:hypothetical protein